MTIPLVSVVVIFWQARKFLDEAIQSVFAQTHTNWELILVDDGSTDGSTERAWSYARNDPERVRCIAHDGHLNKGMSASRNLGLRHARGTYIAVLDADDVWLPTTLAEQVGILASHPQAVMVYGPVQWWFSWSGKQDDARRDVVQDLKTRPDVLVEPPGLLPIFLRHEGAAPSGIMVRASALADVGGFEESFRGMYEDQVFRVKVCVKGAVFVSSRCWYRWRKHEDSCCARVVRDGDHPIARLRFLRWVERYLKQEGVEDRATWAVLKSQLWPHDHPLLSAVARLFRRIGVLMRVRIAVATVERLLPRSGKRSGVGS
jgi:glycosyltransferase involved in cell wall biosynthesis